MIFLVWGVANVIYLVVDLIALAWHALTRKVAT